MNEPKKRGRPTNAEREAKQRMEDLAAQMPFVEPIVQTVRKTETLVWPNGVEETSTFVSVTPAAQAYAMRVWNGQSVDAPREWRVERVKQALQGQGLPFEGVELP